jgi:hypothetical protein
MTNTPNTTEHHTDYLSDLEAVISDPMERLLPTVTTNLAKRHTASTPVDNPPAQVFRVVRCKKWPAPRATPTPISSA